MPYFTDRRTFLLMGGAAAVAVMMAGCGNKGDAESVTPLRPPEAKIDGDLAYYAPTGYVPDDVLAAFEREHGVKINQTYFSTVDEMIQKLGAGASYDITFMPSNFFARATKADLLLPIDHSAMKNWGEVTPLFNDPPFELEAQHLAGPYAMGGIGLAYRKSKVNGLTGSWNDLWNLAPKLDRRAFIFDDVTVSMTMALGRLGLPTDTDSVDDLNKAADSLIGAVTDAGAPALRLPIEDVAQSGEVEAIHFAVRLFRRVPAHRWQRIVCERVTAAATEYVALPIRHHGYASTIARYSKLDRNRALLERAVAAAPADPELRQRLAWTLLVLGDAYTAAAHAEAALRRTRSTMTGLLAIDTLARARMAAGDLTGAANACRTALALRPDWIDPRLVLAEASQRAGKTNDALLHYARFLADREKLLADVTWPVRLPRLSSLTAEPIARAELASVHAAAHRAESRHDVPVRTA